MRLKYLWYFTLKWHVLPKDFKMETIWKEFKDGNILSSFYRQGNQELGRDKSTIPKPYRE